jgi:hypothetical protein
MATQEMQAQRRSPDFFKNTPTSRKMYKAAQNAQLWSLEMSVPQTHVFKALI